MDRDTRTLKQLAQEAYDVQMASNLSGVLLGWHKSYCRLRELLGNDAREHAISILWLDKVQDLMGAYPGRYSVQDAYGEVRRLIETVDAPDGTDTTEVAEAIRSHEARNDY